jgi:hypothetical protein
MDEFHAVAAAAAAPAGAPHWVGQFFALQQQQFQQIQQHIQHTNAPLHCTSEKFFVTPEVTPELDQEMP